LISGDSENVLSVVVLTVGIAYFVVLWWWWYCGCIIGGDGDDRDALVVVEAGCGGGVVGA